MYTSLYRTAREADNKFINDLKNRAVSTILAQLHKVSNLPTKDELLNVTIEDPLSWRPQVQQLEQGQHYESYFEHKKTLELLCIKVDKYIAMDDDFRRHTILHGPPGSDKTLLALLQLLYAFSQGLFGIVTSI